MLEARHCVTALRAQLRRPSSWAVTGRGRGDRPRREAGGVLGGDGDLHRLNYDSLVIALGGETATFGIAGITEYAVGMKTLADAFALRNRIIEMLERADLEADADERAAQLTFVVGGAGFSGVETAGEIEDFVRRVRRRYYPKIRQDEVTLPHRRAQGSRAARDAGRHGRRTPRRKLRERGYRDPSRDADEGGARGRRRRRRRHVHPLAHGDLDRWRQAVAGGRRVGDRGRQGRPSHGAADDGRRAATGCGPSATAR